MVAKSDKCRFIGNVNVGKDISIRELSKYYSGIVLVSKRLSVILIKYYSLRINLVTGPWSTRGELFEHSWRGETRTIIIT